MQRKAASSALFNTVGKGPTGVIKSVLDTQRTDGGRRDEIFVDIVERISCTFNQTGYVTASQIDGAIQVQMSLLLDPHFPMHTGLGFLITAAKCKSTRSSRRRREVPWRLTRMIVYECLSLVFLIVVLMADGCTKCQRVISHLRRDFARSKATWLGIQPYPWR